MDIIFAFAAGGRAIAANIMFGAVVSAAVVLPTLLALVDDGEFVFGVQVADFGCALCERSFFIFWALKEFLDGLFL